MGGLIMKTIEERALDYANKLSLNSDTDYFDFYQQDYIAGATEQQDKLYGKHMRVWNPIGKNNQSNGFRCTVCGAETKSNIPITPKINKI